MKVSTVVQLAALLTACAVSGCSSSFDSSDPDSVGRGNSPACSLLEDAQVDSLTLGGPIQSRSTVELQNGDQCAWSNPDTLETVLVEHYDAEAPHYGCQYSGAVPVDGLGPAACSYRDGIWFTQDGRAVRVYWTGPGSRGVDYEAILHDLALAVRQNL